MALMAASLWSRVGSQYGMAFRVKRLSEGDLRLRARAAGAARVLPGVFQAGQGSGRAAFPIGRRGRPDAATRRPAWTASGRSLPCGYAADRLGNSSPRQCRRSRRPIPASGPVAARTWWSCRARASPPSARPRRTCRRGRKALPARISPSRATVLLAWFSSMINDHAVRQNDARRLGPLGQARSSLVAVLNFLSSAARMAFWRGSVTGLAAPKLSTTGGGGGLEPGGSGCGSKRATVRLSGVKYCLATRWMSAGDTWRILSR